MCSYSNRFKLWEVLSNSSSTILNSYPSQLSSYSPTTPATTEDHHGYTHTPITITSAYRRSTSMLKSTTIFDVTTTATLKVLFIDLLSIWFFHNFVKLVYNFFLNNDYMKLVYDIFYKFMKSVNVCLGSILHSIL